MSTLKEWMDQVNERDVVRLGNAHYNSDAVCAAIKELGLNITMVRTGVQDISPADSLLFQILKTELEG